MNEWRADREYSKVARTGRCPSCTVELGIIPASILGEVGLRAGTPEAELDFATSLSNITDDKGRRMVLADPMLNFTCPECGHTANVHDV
jgi:hypothetical protein